MRSWILPLFAKIGLFFMSLGLGVVSYLMAHELRHDGTGQRASSLAQIPAQPVSLSLDMEPALLARTESPVDAASDVMGVYYVLQSDGKIIRIAPEMGGSAAPNLYASLADDRTDRSLGFSSLVIHPRFHIREDPGYGRFYVVVSEQAGAGSIDFLPEFGGGSEHHQDVVYEYVVEDPLLPEFRGSRRELMRFSQPGPDHNVSGLAFDLTGLLYVGVGDGATGEVSRRSPSRNASSLTSAYGKVLRIDPLGSNSMNGQYGIPDGNPFRLVSEALPELWVFGLRAPRSLSYDPFQQGLCIAESAAAGIEEINLSLRGGEHYGWDISADTDKLSRAALARLDEVVTSPAFSLNLESGLAARPSGSLFYRGESFPSLAGNLLVASHDGQLLALRPATAVEDSPRLARIDLGRVSELRFSGLRAGARGELILLCEDGQIFEMRKSASLGTGGSKHRSLFCLLPDSSANRS